MDWNDLKFNVIIGLLVLNLIGMYFVVGNRLERMEDRLSDMNHRVQDVSWQVDNVDDSVRRQLVNMREESLNFVSGFDYQYESLDQDKKTMMTGFTVELKESHADSKLYLVAKDESGKSEKTELVQDNGLVYKKGLKLDLEENYTFSIVEEQDGNMKQLNYEDYPVYLKRDFYERRVESLGGGSGMDNKSVYYDRRFSVNTFGIEEFKIEDITFVVAQNGEILYEEKVTDGLFNMKDLSAKQKTIVAAGDLLVDRPESFGMSSQTEMAVMEEVKEKRAGAPEVFAAEMEEETYVFQKVLVYDDYSEYGLTKDMARVADGYLVVRFKDGSEKEIW